MVGDLHLHFVDVVLKIALLLGAVWENHAAVSVLDACTPLALVAAAICPVHLSVAFSLVILVFSFVDVTAGPGKLAEATFTVLDVVAFI